MQKCLFYTGIFWFWVYEEKEEKSRRVWSYSALVSVETKPHWISLTISLTQPGPGSDQLALFDWAHSAPQWLTFSITPEKKKNNRNNSRPVWKRVPLVLFAVKLRSKLVPSDICDSAVVVIAVGSVILISSSFNLSTLSSLSHTQSHKHTWIM